MTHLALIAFVLCAIASASLNDMFKKKNRLPRDAFDNLQGTVYISQSDDSVHHFQEILEEELKNHGMRIVNLSNVLLSNLLKTGVYPEELTEIMIDATLVGRIVSRTGITQKTVRNRWYKRGYTETGLGFSHTLVVRLYNSSGDLITTYLKGAHSEDYPSAFRWFAVDLSKFLYNELKK